MYLAFWFAVQYGATEAIPKMILEMLKVLANPVTIAISNASMFEQVRNGRERQGENLQKVL